MADGFSTYVMASRTMPNNQRMNGNFTENLNNNNPTSPIAERKNYVELSSQNADQNAALQRESDVRAGADNPSRSNGAAGYTPPTNSPETPLDLNRINNADKAYKYEVVGTTVNKDNPTTGGSAASTFKGTPSLFNNYYLVRYHSLNDNESNLPTKLGTAEGSLDYKGLASDPLYKNPTTSIIVKTFNGEDKKLSFFGFPEKVYTYSDFLYLKDYNPYGNNKLITLRRFMAPVYDECRLAIRGASPEFRKPIAKALTYLGKSGNSLNSFTKMTIGIPTSSITGTDTDPKKVDAGKEKEAGSPAASETSKSITSYMQRVLSIMIDPKGADNTTFGKWTSAYDPWTAGGTLQDLVYGPVNVIKDTLIRAKGLDFSSPSIDVTFEYSLKAIERLNPKAAMLDIFSNMLALTYNHAMFWGGENRFILDRGNFPLVQPELLFKSLSELTATGSNIDAVKAGAEGGAGAITGLGKYITSLVEDVKNGGSDGLRASKDLLNTAITAMATRDGTTYETFKTALEGQGQLLTGNPTGEWHLQVGNPFAPIMMIGNLWCTSTSFEFNDELSVDDFPTELKFSCTLKHGRNRDASDIQSIFNAGGGRIYYPYKDAAIDANASSSTYNTETAVVFKPDNVLGAWNRVTTDRSGLTIDNILKLNKSKNQSSNVSKQIVQTISDYTKE
jgi:hypothetical protein